MWWLLACTSSAPEIVLHQEEASSQSSKEAADTAPARGPDGLAEAAGVDLVRANCQACHSLAIVRDQHLSRERWDVTITWMQQTQGLWDLPPDTRAGLLDYLSQHQGPLSASKGANAAESPWATPTYRANPFW